jgi:hypothetical protein
MLVEWYRCTLIKPSVTAALPTVHVNHVRDACASETCDVVYEYSMPSCGLVAGGWASGVICAYSRISIPFLPSIPFIHFLAVAIC